MTARPGRSGGDVPRAGSEPVTARSPLRLRSALAAVALVVFAAGTGALAWWSTATTTDGSPNTAELATLAGVCGVIAATALVDLLVVRRRLRR
ncbi:DUF6343 family protein [Streptomyces sp. ICBB 8177]|uniref:DUF6343 family protein n=1 Tax=Streptomyces sp. ICBB 8177 TaxID=563922 RepID=UPI000D684AE5|nr:DUF6343 family protein [Streptomyces sp. ICBB 8177]PWI42922.1 hypothetical protein CK485_11745 [Streptomyces sp. ICBB 8177]